MPAAKPNTTLGSVAVIGGCGLLGGGMIRLLLDQYPDSDIHGLDLTTKRNRVEAPNVTYHECDITDLLGIEEIFLKQKFDVVIHTAGLMPLEGIPEPVIFRVNVEGTKNLITASQNTGVKAFVFTSSASVVVGAVTAVVNVDERWPVLFGKDQPEFYSETKALGEAAVLAANRSPSSTLLTCSIRPAGIFGEGDQTALYRQLMITGFKRLFQMGSNDNLFDWTHVDNVAYAHILAASALLQTHNLPTQPLDTEKVDGEAFFVTNGEPTYFWDFIRRVWWERATAEDKTFRLKQVWVLNASLAIFIAGILEFFMGLFGKVPNFSRFAVRQSTIVRYYNINKIKNRLGYKSIVSLEDGIRSGVAEVYPRVLGRNKK